MTSDIQFVFYMMFVHCSSLPLSNLWCALKHTNGE